MNEQNDALIRVRSRQIAPTIKQAQVEARKTIRDRFKALRDDLDVQRVELSVQQVRDIATSNAAVTAEFESQAKSAADHNQLATVIARTDMQARTV